MSVIDILEELGVEYRAFGEHHHVSSQDWISIDCFQCSPGWKHFRLGINSRFIYGNCWKCGRVNLVEALSAISGRPYREVIHLLGGLQRPIGHFEEGVRRGQYLPPKGLGELLERHKKYLKSRGFDIESLEKLWGIRGIGLNSRLAWRVFIPITLNNELVSWTTRSTDLESTYRYIGASVNEELISKKALLYGEEKVKQSIIICEGPADVWKIGPGAVATMGTAITPAQVLKMSKYPVRAVCLDSDAKQQADRLCNSLAVFPGVTHLVELDAKDPGSASDKEIKLLRKAFL